MTNILITGHKGMVGSAVCKALEFYDNVKICIPKFNFDLRQEESVEQLFKITEPDYVIHCAAVVGGLKFNKEQPDKLYRDNILINTHVIHYAHLFNVRKLIAFSSACAFEDGIYPFKEDNLQEGKPYEGNLAYGYAKRMVDIQIGVYNKLHKRKDLTVIPVSIYGPNDNFSLDNGHFVSSLIHKTYNAKEKKEPLTIWGDGSPLRELLFSNDLAEILIQLLFKETPDKLIIPGQEVSVRDVAMAIVELMGFKGQVVFDKSKPAGQYRKPTDPTRFKKVMGEFSFTPYREGLKATINWFLDQINDNKSVRGLPPGVIFD